MSRRSLEVLSRLDFTPLDAFEQWPQILVYVSLPHLQRQAFPKSCADRELVNEAHIHSRNGDRTALAASMNRLPQHVRTVRFEPHCLFRTIV